MTVQSQLVFGGIYHNLPCSERNTAFLQRTSPRYPLQNDTKCVDITSVRNIRLSQKILKSPLYATFFEKTHTADTLYADHMNLTKFPIFVVRNLPYVETIDLSGNRIRRLPTKMFKIAHKLDKLLIADNQVVIPRRKPLISSRTVKTLMLSNNGIEQLYRETFAMIPTLEVLYLDGNKLTTIALIGGMLPNLKYLHLGNNYLSKIPPKDSISPSLVFYITKSQQNKKKRETRRSKKRVLERQL